MYVPIVTNLAVLGFLEILRPNTWLNFYTEMLIVPLYTIRGQLEPLTQFALRRFSDECDAVRLRDAVKYPVNYLQQRFILFGIERETRW